MKARWLRKKSRAQKQKTELKNPFISLECLISALNVYSSDLDAIRSELSATSGDKMIFKRYSKSKENVK